MAYRNTTNKMSTNIPRRDFLESSLVLPWVIPEGIKAGMAVPEQNLFTANLGLLKIPRGDGLSRRLVDVPDKLIVLEEYNDPVAQSDMVAVEGKGQETRTVYHFHERPQSIDYTLRFSPHRNGIRVEAEGRRTVYGHREVNPPEHLGNIIAILPFGEWYVPHTTERYWNYYESRNDSAVKFKLAKDGIYIPRNGQFTKLDLNTQEGLDVKTILLTAAFAYAFEHNMLSDKKAGDKYSIFVAEMSRDAFERMRAGCFPRLEKYKK